MANINIKKIEKIEKQSYSIHDSAKCSYTVFEHNGKKYLQIDTYGTSRRECKDKISQSIQIDENSALELIELLHKVFK